MSSPTPPTPPISSAPDQGYNPTLSHKEVTKTISALGIRKANTEPWQLFMLGILAGIYISFGGHLYLVSMCEKMGRILSGAVFSVGLVLVVIAGAELFTGNILMIIGSLTGRFSISKMLQNWLMVYLGNFVGAYFFALLVWGTGLLGPAGALNPLGQLAVSVAGAKIALPFGEAFFRGVLCNALVILAIVMATMSKDVISKIFSCILPIMAFVACGYEHCIANMYLIPIGLIAKGVSVGDQVAMFHNIIPVTLGNIVGGVVILIIHPNRIRQLQFLWKS
jgi:formate/nitrite transporter